MLSTLADLVAHSSGTANNGYQWHTLDIDTVQQALPFWDTRDLQRVSTNLREKGVIIIASAPITQSPEFKFAFNEAMNAKGHTARAPQSPPQRVHAQNRGKNFIAGNWQPNETTLAQLGQLSIPSDFAMRQVPEFVTYWRDRNEPQRSWEQKFISWTIPRWRSFEEQEYRRQKATTIPSTWQPEAATVEDLCKRKIPQQFILDHVREFIAYWQATGEQHISWEAKFIQRIQTVWADIESKRNVSKEAMSIPDGWRPSADAMDVMTVKSAIPRSFIDDTIPEFIIYWQEKGLHSNTWNSLFIKHVRLQWHRFQHAEAHSSEAQLIPTQWQPSADVYDILKLANIDAAFARELIPEFVLYWRDRNELHRSWNSKFLQHTKHRWALRHDKPTAQHDDNSLRSTREISLEEELNDTSWAS